MTAVTDVVVVGGGADAEEAPVAAFAVYIDNADRDDSSERHASSSARDSDDKSCSKLVADATSLLAGARVDAATADVATPGHRDPGY